MTIVYRVILQEPLTPAVPVPLRVTLMRSWAKVEVEKIH